MLDGPHEIDADIPFRIAAAHGEDQHAVACDQAAYLEPVRIRGLPPLVVDPRRQLGHIVGGRVGFQPDDLPEVVDGVGGIAGASAHA